MKECIKNWRLNNPKRNKENRRKWVKNNPEKAKMHKYKRRALESNLDPIPDGFQEKQLIKQNYICGNLFCKCDLRTLPSKDRTIEHLIPLKRGGTHDPENLRVWCRSCNSSKQDKTIEEYYWSKI